MCSGQHDDSGCRVGFSEIYIKVTKTTGEWTRTLLTGANCNMDSGGSMDFEDNI